MINNYIKTSFRAIKKDNIYSLINIVGLAVGLACFITIMLWVKYQLSYDKFHTNADRLYRVAFTNDTEEFHGYWQTGKLANYLKENYPEITHSTNFSEMQFKIAHKKKGFYSIGSYVDSLFFEMFSFPFINGNSLTALNKPKSIVITESLSNKLFGSDNPLDKIVKLNDVNNYTITGVIADVPNNSHIKFDFLIPFSDAQSGMKTWNSKWTNTYIMLQDESQHEIVDIKIAGVMDKFQPTWNNILYLTPITKSHLHNLGGGGLVIYAVIFSAMALIIVLLACVNFMNLSTSRSEIRQKEIFIKKVSGSKRSQLFKQFLSETIISAFLALIVAIVLIEITLPSINNLLKTKLDLTYNISAILTLTIIALSTGILSGSYAAIYLSSLIPNRIIKGGFQKSGKRKWKARYILIVAQFTTSIFFVICMLLIVNQLKYVKSKDLGLNSESVIKIMTLGKLNDKSKELKTELLKNPNIINITVSNNELTKLRNTGPIEWKGKEPNKLVEIGYNWVDYDFLETFDLKMSEGRFFSSDFSTDISNAFILNEKAVAYLGLENPIGMNVKSWFGIEGTVIGIIKDYHTESLHKEISPLALLCSEKANYMFIKINPHNISETLKFIEKEIKQLVPDDPYEYQFFENQLLTLYQTETLTGKLTVMITILAILISCLGLFGLSLSAVGQRRKEISIRKSNGAKTSEVMVMLTKGFTIYVIVAFIIACPIALYSINKWLENFAYKTEISWWIFALAGAIALFIALVTVSWQSWRAASRNPVEALRYE